jgi:hypothetical protein
MHRVHIGIVGLAVCAVLGCGLGLGGVRCAGLTQQRCGLGLGLGCVVCWQPVLKALTLEQRHTNPPQ